MDLEAKTGVEGACVKGFRLIYRSNIQESTSRVVGDCQVSALFVAPNRQIANNTRWIVQVFRDVSTYVFRDVYICGDTNIARCV
eukprot:2388919-Pyramimonas_sp.AAC.1